MKTLSSNIINKIVEGLLPNIGPINARNVCMPLSIGAPKGFQSESCVASIFVTSWMQEKITVKLNRIE